MAEETSGDKTESASPRRREEARKEGRVARSADLNTSVTLIAALVTLAWLGPSLMDALKHNVQAESLWGR